MKKILALALALLMMATTASLAACSKDDPEPNDGDDGEYEYNDTDSKDTGDETDRKNPADTDDGNEDEYTDGRWIDKNDNICVGVNNVALREGPGRDYEWVKTLKAGTVLKRTATNGDWHKVEYEDKECYVHSDYTSLNPDDFTFVEYKDDEQKQLSVIGDNKINLRSSPFYTDYDPSDNVVFSGFSAIDTDDADESLTLLAVSESGNWYKVSFTGTWGSKTYEDEIVYLAASSAKYVNGLSASSSGSNGENIRG